MNKKQLERHAYWQKIIDQQKNSGLSQEKYCTQQNIPYRRFKYYYYRLPKQDNNNLKRIEDRATAAAFSPIKIKNESPSSSANNGFIKMKLPNDIQCQMTLGLLGHPELIEFLKRVKAL